MQIIGLIAAFATVAGYAPQAYKVIRTQKTRDISLVGYSIIITSCICWVIYGIGTSDAAIITANSLVGVLAITVAIVTIKNLLRSSV